jgi:enolase-phosphatase E1
VSGTRPASGPELILLDIEGTTTPLRFVSEVLFPYARAGLRSHLERHAASPEWQSIVDDLRAEHHAAGREHGTVPAWNDESMAATLASAAAFAEWLMDRDRKSTPLKDLQGRIWRDGYERGEIVGEVFPDVPAALDRWQAQRVRVGIFSSGSVLAQQLLFRYSSAGDLTACLQWYFDTHVGAKADPESYRRIARTVGIAAEHALFLSDSPRELDAAIGAGMQARLVVRPGNGPVDVPARYVVVTTLDEVAPVPGAPG